MKDAGYCRGIEVESRWRRDRWVPLIILSCTVLLRLRYVKDFVLRTERQPGRD